MVFKEFFKKIAIVLLFTSPVVLVASNHKNEKNEKKRVYEEFYGQGNWSTSEEAQKIKKRKLHVIKKLLLTKEELLDKAKKVKEANENSAICTIMPADAWTVVGNFLSLKDLLSLKLVSRHFGNLFYKGEYDEFSKLRLPKLILPSIVASSEQEEMHARQKVADFLGRSCISRVKGNLENFIVPIKGGVWESVEHLDFEGAQIIDDQLNIVLQRLPHLKSLNLNGCKAFTGGTSVDWLSVKELETLDIGGTNITAQGVQAILDNCPELRVLIADDCDEFLLEELNCGNSKKIVELDLSENFITTVGLQKLLNSCPHLKILKLRGSSGFSVDAIDWSVVGELSVLDLGDGVRVSNKALKKIGIACPKLSALLLANQISQEPDISWGSDVNWENGLDWGLFKNLVELDLGFNDYVTSKGVEKIVQYCPKLKVLRGFCYQGDFSSVGNITSFSRLDSLEVQLAGEVQSPLRTFFQALSKNSSLKELAIVEINLLNQSSGIIWDELGKTLEKLDIAFSRLTREEFQAIINGCPGLKEWTFSSGHSTFESMKGLDWTKVSKKLFSLNLSTNMLSKESLQPIFYACNGLKNLVFDECGGFDIGTLDWTNLSCLESLSLSDSPISAEGLLLILESCPALNYLYLGVDNDLELEEFYEGSARLSELRELLYEFAQNED